MKLKLIMYRFATNKVLVFQGIYAGARGGELFLVGIGLTSQRAAAKDPGTISSTSWYLGKSQTPLNLQEFSLFIRF